MAQRKKITPKLKEKFLSLLADTGNVSKCCLALNVSRRHIYLARRDDSVFAKEWLSALATAVELLEDEAWRRAFEGIDRPIYYKGELIDMVKDYSDTLLMHRLQAEKPDKYQYRQKVDANVTGELTVKIVRFSESGNNNSE